MLFELISLILSYLANRDIKHLRLTCRFLLSTTRLSYAGRFCLLYPRVFRAIADHEIFRVFVLAFQSQEHGNWPSCRSGYIRHALS